MDILRALPHGHSVDDPHPSSAEAVRAVYERHAEAWDRHRAQHFAERVWLDRFVDGMAAPGPVLDVGCGSGAPIAGYLIGRGYDVCGVDLAPAMVAIARARWPGQTWRVDDMRTMVLDRTYAGVVAWDSFFHLRAEEQTPTLERFGQCLAPGGVLLVTIGDTAGEVFGTVEGDRVYHASLGPQTYREVLTEFGFGIEDLALRDPTCGLRSVLLAKKRE